MTDGVFHAPSAELLVCADERGIVLGRPHRQVVIPAVHQADTTGSQARMMLAPEHRGDGDVNVLVE